MSNDKAQSANEINTMTNVKNQIPCLPKAVNLTFEIYAFICHLNFGIWNCFLKNYRPNLFLNSWVSMGTTVKRSPTRP